MEYKNNVKIVELERQIAQMQKDISKIYDIVQNILQNTPQINQNSVELEQNSTKGQENAAHTQSRIHTERDRDIISTANLRQFSFNTRQHTPSHRRDNERNTPLRSLLISIDSARTPNERGISDSGERNLTQPRSAAVSQTSKDIETLYRKSLKCTELEKAEFNRLFLAFLKLNKDIEPNLEKKFNDNISKIIKEHNAKKPNVYAAHLEHFTQETMKRIKKEVFFLNAYGYEISPQNTKAIQNLLLARGQDRTMS